MKKGFKNANIWQKEETAFVVEDGKFIWFGRGDEIADILQEGDSCIDLNKQFVLPGFFDSHMHLVGLGAYLTNLQLASCRSVNDVIALIKERMNTVEEGEWIIGRGYNEDYFEDHSQLSKELLDAITKDIPISLTRACGHVLVANSKALELAGINENTTVDGGHIDFEKGRLEENALYLMHNAWPKETPESIKKYIRKGMEYCHRFGITSVASDDYLSLTDDYHMVLQAYQEIVNNDELTLRIHQQCEFATKEEFQSYLDLHLEDSPYFRSGPLKMLLDGSLGGRTAAMVNPYHDDPTKKGIFTYTNEDAKAWVEMAHQNQMGVITHAIGDAAVDQILDIFEGVLKDGNPYRSGLVHCQIMRPDQIQRTIDLGLVCYFQSIFIDYDASILEERVGKDLAKTSYPYKTFFQNTLASNGSDAPVEMPNVLRGIQLACTRESLLYPGRIMNQEEKLTIDEAITSYTMSGAIANRVDDRIGKLENDYFADFVVLDQDITKCETEKIYQTKVVMTISNGEIVYQG